MQAMTLFFQISLAVEIIAQSEIRMPAQRVDRKIRRAQSSHKERVKRTDSG